MPRRLALFVLMLPPVEWSLRPACGNPLDHFFYIISSYAVPLFELGTPHIAMLNISKLYPDSDNSNKVVRLSDK